MHNFEVSEKLSGCNDHLIRFIIGTERMLTANKFMISDYKRN